MYLKLSCSREFTVFCRFHSYCSIHEYYRKNVNDLSMFTCVPEYELDLQIDFKFPCLIQCEF